MSGAIQFADYHPAADGVTDDTPALNRCFADALSRGGGSVVIPPGNYFVSGYPATAIPSNTTVFAHGARFYLPRHLGDGARVVLFSGADVSNFAWFGGHFQGCCFDHRNPPNTWEPNANTRIFAITTTPGGRTDNLTFRDLSSLRVAGAVVNVEGVKRAGSESEVETFATNITVQNCTLVDSGKFMWDYGLLWQILVWPEEYTPADVAMAGRYFHNDLIREGIRMPDGDDRVFLDNATNPLPVSQDARPQHALCFYGDTLPANIVRGRKYFVVESCPTHLKVSDQPDGAPIRFAGSAGPNARLIHNLQQAFYALFQPAGAGPGKGCIDLVACRNTNLTGNKISALGDTMHLQCCHNNVFSSNQITGSRMGAFFLAEWCRNSTVVGNTVDGTNGSRVMSVEKSNEDVTIIGNTFRNGGRGSWINQPRRIIFQGNVFVNNTTKNEPDPWRGRRSFETGDYETNSEIYFTLHEAGGSYGPVILRDNIFATGPECRDTVTFAANGHDILVEGNVFSGPARSIRIDPSCTNVHVGVNPGYAED